MPKRMGYGLQLVWLSIVVTVAVMVGGGYLVYRTFWASESFRYRVTLEADVGGQRVTGSGVLAATVLALGGTNVRGEAISLDLGRHGFVFAFFRPTVSFTEQRFLDDAPADAFPRSGRRAAWVRQLRRNRPRAELPSDKLPTLVRFREISEPTSVELVAPADLAATFGPGVTLRRVTVEITDEPVTRGIEAKLPWLANLKASGHPIGSHAESTSVGDLDLDYASFKREGS